MCYSPTNSIFTADEAPLLTLATKGNVSISNIRLTTTGLDELCPADLIVTPTGIGSVCQGMKISVQGGTLCITSDHEAKLQIYSPDGRIVRRLNVRRGQNTFDGLHKGIYMINNKKIILR